MEVITNSARDKYFRANNLPQIIASFTLFYILIFIHFSPRLSFMLHTLKLYLLAIPLHSLDKIWVFLICNALLVVLGFFPSSSSSKVDDHQDDHNIVPEKEHDDHILLLESAHDHDQPDFEDDHRVSANLGIKVEEDGEEEEKVVTDIIICITEGDADDDEEDESCVFEYEDEIQEDEELEDERIILEKLSAEELNKKFDDFITKMKGKFRVDVQQQHLVRCY